MKVDIVLASGIAVATVERATSEIPIVFPMSNDPVGAGLVKSLARPGGNATGLSNQATDLAGKRLEFLREVVPGLRRLAIMANAGFPQAVLERDAVQTQAQALNLDVARIDIRRVEDIAPAFAAMNARSSALYVVGDAFLNSNRSQIATLALRARLPAIFNNRTFVATGGLMSYGPDFADQWRRSAELVDKILRGAKPADIPVEQPTKFDLAVNLKTAKALGLSIPQTLLSLADEVIE
jgi:putative ABC transport system substrate-binding protein